MTIIGNRPSSSTPTRLGALLLAATMLVACTPATSEQPDNRQSSESRSAPETLSEQQVGPLGEFQNRIFGIGAPIAETPAEQQAQRDTQRRQEEEMIAACMAEQGFTYLPYLLEGAPTIVIQPPAETWGTRAFAERYGWGISTDPFGVNEPLEIDVDAGPVDPNQPLLDAMSPAELAAWEEALWGAPQPDGEWDPMLAGCRGIAQAYFWPDPVQSQFVALFDELNGFWASVENDPQTLALTSNWLSCMADRGYTGLTGLRVLRFGPAAWLPTNYLLSSDDANAGLMAEWDQILGRGGGFTTMGNQLRFVVSDGSLASDAAEISGADPGAVAAFTAREFAFAVATFDCQDAVDFDVNMRRIQIALEQQFVDRHRAELEAWAQDIESLRS